MRRLSWERMGMRFFKTSILAVGLVVLTAVAVRAETVRLRHYQDSNGDHWLYGCVPSDLAQKLVDNANFQVGFGVVGILCFDGDIPVYKRLEG